MAKLHWFNPQNDLALAANMCHFSPPKNALDFSMAGQMLPLWYGDDGDVVYSPDFNHEWFQLVKQQFDLKTDLFEEDNDVVKCVPWGWSLDALSHFRNLMEREDCLPSVEQVMRHRSLSHRRSSIAIIRRLKELIPFINNESPVECNCVDDCLRCIMEYDGNAFVKLPYSSSGRGVFNVKDWSLKMLTERTRGMINRQGSVLIEKALDKVIDFAMLFSAHDGNVEFVGYSAFFNDNGAAYSGNIIMPDGEIRSAYLGRYIDESCLLELEHKMPVVLTEMFGSDYNGYFGVDMMVYRDCGTFKIAPCVEVNLRMTMGVVAHRLGRKYLVDGSHGRLRVDFMRSNRPNEPVVADGKLVRGEISLIPPHPKFSITLGVV